MPLPYRVFIAAAADSPVGALLREIEDERLSVIACATEDDAHRSLAMGLPDLGILDGSLPGASLLRIYSKLRQEDSFDLAPVLFTSHALDVTPPVHDVPDVYLAADADIDSIRNALYRSLDLPLPEPVGNRPDPLVTNLLSALQHDGFDAATYASASSVLTEIEDGLPAAAVLDATLPEAELAAVYRSLRAQPGGADLPILFLHDKGCPPGAIVKNGADIYLGEGASVEEALAMLRGKVFPDKQNATAASLSDMRKNLVPSPKKPFSLMSFFHSSKTSAPKAQKSPGSLGARLLRATPIAAMIVIGGFAGVITVKTFDTRSWPLAHPIEVSAATPPALETQTAIPTATGSPLQSIATRAALSAGSGESSRVTRGTPETAGCALLPAFASLIDAIGADVVGTCLDQPQVLDNGDSQQATSTGMFALRRDQNWVAFTDGYRTWLRGPQGVQQRLNTERFSWETASSVLDFPPMARLSDSDESVS